MGLIIAIACGFAWFQFSDPFSHFLFQHAPAAYARQLSSNGPAILATGEAFLLRRTPYDKLFPRGRYMPDPFESGGLQ